MTEPDHKAARLWAETELALENLPGEPREGAKNMAYCYLELAQWVDNGSEDIERLTVELHKARNIEVHDGGETLFVPAVDYINALVHEHGKLETEAGRLRDKLATIESERDALRRYLSAVAEAADIDGFAAPETYAQRIRAMRNGLEDLRETFKCEHQAIEKHTAECNEARALAEKYWNLADRPGANLDPLPWKISGR